MDMIPVAIVYDEAYTKHLTGFGHPESPSRLFAIGNALQQAGLMTPDSTLKPRSATLEELLLCHSEAYIDLVEEECAFVGHIGIRDGSVCVSTGDAPICPESYDIARLAVGGVLTAVDAVVAGHATRAFCAVRPPGHHACHDRGMGFCLFNNVAIGARYAQKKYHLERVLIVDWDVHHGNGTQDIFQEDKSVFYFSTHQWPFYPGTGAADDHGMAGNISNAPIRSGPDSRKQVLEAFETRLPEILQHFTPDIVFISCGFDGHEKDPLGGFNMTDADYAHLTRLIKNIADTHCHGRVISVLEGGYSLEALASASVEHVTALSLSCGTHNH